MEHPLALEGPFVQISNDAAAAEETLEWKWSQVEPRVAAVLRNRPHGVLLIKHLEYIAKSSKEHLRFTIANKVWTAKWTCGVVEMIATNRKQLDDDCSTISALSKLFLQKWDSPMSRSCGVYFSEVYLNPEWEETPQRPSNSRYLRIGYPYFYESI